MVRPRVSSSSGLAGALALATLALWACTPLLGLDGLTYRESDAGAGGHHDMDAGGGEGGHAPGDLLVGFAFPGTLADGTYGIAALDDGSALAAGCLGGTSDAGTPPITACSPDSQVLLLRVSGGGDVQHAGRFAGGTTPYASSAAADGADNAFVAGTFDATIDLGAGGLTPPATSGNRDVFIAKMASTGRATWSLPLGFDGGATSGGVAVSSAGLHAVGGAFLGTFGPDPSTTATSPSPFVAVFDTDGTPSWSAAFPTTSNALPASCAFAGGQLLLAGAFDGMMDLGDGVPVTGQAFDGFLASYDTQHKLAWKVIFGDSTGATMQVVTGVAADTKGNALVVGTFDNRVDFGQTPIVSAGNADGFVAKIDPAGKPIWIRRFGGADVDEGLGVATDSNDNVLVAGSFSGVADIGDQSVTSNGQRDAFVLKLDPKGIRVWLRHFGDLIDDRATAIAVGPDDSVWATGTFNGTIELGGKALKSAGSTDVFVARFAP